MTALGTSCERLGIASGAKVTRLLTDYLSSLPPKNYSGLSLRDAVFNGVTVRIYKSSMKLNDLESKSQAIVFLHGGGWVFGSIDTHDHMARRIARNTGALLVSVQYRLAPEHPFPAPLEDCITATNYLFDQAEEYGVDPSRVAVLGDSAGGNLAASVALHFRNTKSKHILKLQVLLYPSLQAVDLQLPSYVQNDDVMYGDAFTMASAIVLYMGGPTYLVPQFANNTHVCDSYRKHFASLVNRQVLDDVIDDDVPSVPCSSKEPPAYISTIFNPSFMPLMERDLSRLPETYVVTLEHDVLRDDGIIYLRRLQSSGVKVTWRHYKGGYHGQMAFIEEPIRTDLGEKAMDELIEFLNTRL